MPKRVQAHSAAIYARALSHLAEDPDQPILLQPAAFCAERSVGKSVGSLDAFP
jgi:hypothetical protein